MREEEMVVEAGGYIPDGTGGGSVTGYYTPTGGFSDPEGGGGVGIDPAFFRGDGNVSFRYRFHPWRRW